MLKSKPWNAPFSLPKGVRFDLSTNQWFIPTPTETRPLLERAKRGERLDLAILEDRDSAYLLVGLSPPMDVEIGPTLDFGPLERWTIEEYESVTQQPSFSAPTPIDDDCIILGSGFMMAVELSPTPTPFLHSLERGLILQSGITEVNEQIFVRSGFEPEELRSILLFWDRFDWPDHNHVTSEVDAEINFLQNAGVLRRSLFSTSGNMLSKKHLTSLHLSAYENAQRLEAGRWACARGSESTYRPNRDNKVSDLVVNLFDAIVVPEANVPLEEVLEFKERRRDELIALRTHLEELCEGTLAAQDIQSAWVRAMENVAKSAEAQTRVAEERGWRKLLAKCSLEISADLSKVATSALLGSLTGDPLSAVLGALTPQITTSLERRDLNNNTDPYRYSFSIQKEFQNR